MAEGVAEKKLLRISTDLPWITRWKINPGFVVTLDIYGLSMDGGGVMTQWKSNSRTSTDRPWMEGARTWWKSNPGFWTSTDHPWMSKKSDLYIEHSPCSEQIYPVFADSEPIIPCSTA